MMAVMRETKTPISDKNFSDYLANFASRIRPNADLSKTNWFQVGGPAEFLFKPTDTNDLAAFLAQLPQHVPVTILGVGSNVIVRDGGIGGVVIKLGRGFTTIASSPLVREGWGEGEDHAGNTPSLTLPHQEGGNIKAGAGALAIHTAATARENDIAGLEFLCGIPGTIGGVVRMNGGAYGSDASKMLIEAEVVTRSGEIKRMSNKELDFSYRHSGLREGDIVTSALFQGQKGEREEIAMRMQKISSEREATQPIRSRTGGSTFKNPDGHKAWELIDQASCRGLKIGGAQVSEQHCNFLINTGHATAADLENLGEEIIRRVKKKTGVTLEWEIQRIGRKLSS